MYFGVIYYYYAIYTLVDVSNLVNNLIKAFSFQCIHLQNGIAASPSFSVLSQGA